MARRIKSLFTFGLHNGEKLLDFNKRDKLMTKKKKIIEVLFGLEMLEEIFFKPSTNMSSNHYCHCVPDSGHIPRMILALP